MVIKISFDILQIAISSLYTLRIILEKASDWQREVYLTFVDFEKVFDALEWNRMTSKLTDIGVPRKMTNLIKAIYRKYSG